MQTPEPSALDSATKGVKHNSLTINGELPEPKDIDILPKQSLFLGCKSDCKNEVIEAKRQEELAKRLKDLYFGVWKSDFKIHSKNEALWGNGYTKSRTGFGQNLKAYTQTEIERFIVNTDEHTFPNFIQDGIVIRNTDFRVMPTSAPFFFNPQNSGQGYPFDYFQNSKVYFNTPVKILHISRDRGWVFAQSYFVSGWVSVHDIGLVDEEFKSKFVTDSIASPVYDNLLLQERFLIESIKVGTIFPLNEEGKIYYATKSGSRAILQSTAMNGHFVKIPKFATKENIALIAEQMLGSKYGWGSFPEGRDCSMLTRDIFVPFGVYLPRNSHAQAFHGSGEYVDLSNMNDAKKEDYILKNGTPFLSLLYMKGHVMLYIGEYQGKALIYHDVWGVRTINNGASGRFIIGGAVVSSLDVGRELPNADKNGLIIRRIEGMKTLK